MKKAREIVIPDDRPLTYKEFVDFRDHAYNSASWYATEYSRTEHQITEKLLKKGYVKGDVNYIDENGVEQSFDIIEWVLQKLRDYYMVDDEALARRFVQRELSSGKGAQWIRTKLTARGISHELVTELLDELKEDDVTADAVARTAEKFMNTSVYRKQPDDFKKRQRLVQHLLSRGFSFDDISLWENYPEE